VTTDPWPLRSSLELGAPPGQSVSVNLTGDATRVLIEVREAGSPAGRPARAGHGPSPAPPGAARPAEATGRDRDRPRHPAPPPGSSQQL